jgi:hypothetical protein
MRDHIKRNNTTLKGLQALHKPALSGESGEAYLASEIMYFPVTFFMN